MKHLFLKFYDHMSLYLISVSMIILAIIYFSKGIPEVSFYSGPRGSGEALSLHIGTILIVTSFHSLFTIAKKELSNFNYAFQIMYGIFINLIYLYFVGSFVANNSTIIGKFLIFWHLFSIVILFSSSNNLKGHKHYIYKAPEIIFNTFLIATSTLLSVYIFKIQIELMFSISLLLSITLSMITRQLKAL